MGTEQVSRLNNKRWLISQILTALSDRGLDVARVVSTAGVAESPNKMCGIGWDSHMIQPEGQTESCIGDDGDKGWQKSNVSTMFCLRVDCKVGNEGRKWMVVSPSIWW